MGILCIHPFLEFWGQQLVLRLPFSSYESKSVDFSICLVFSLICLVKRISALPTAKTGNRWFSSCTFCFYLLEAETGIHWLIHLDVRKTKTLHTKKKKEKRFIHYEQIGGLTFTFLILSKNKTEKGYTTYMLWNSLELCLDWLSSLCMYKYLAYYTGLPRWLNNYSILLKEM